MSYPLTNDLQKMIDDIEVNGTPYTEIELSSSDKYQTILQIIKPKHHTFTITNEKENQNTFIIKGEAKLITFNGPLSIENELNGFSFINIPKGTKYIIENIFDDQILFLLTFYSPKLHFGKTPEESYYSVTPFPETKVIQ